MGKNMIRQSYQLGLIGYPLDHSLSPRLHTAALDALDMKGEYILYPIPPSTEGTFTLDGLLGQLRSGGVHGLNVTIPHKQTVIPYLDVLTPSASSIGAVNTIFSDGVHLIGDNTDAPGFLADLDRFVREANTSTRESSPKTSQTALVLGAGGAARAVVYALAKIGWNIIIAARRIEQAERLIDSLQQSMGADQGATISSHPSTIVLDETPLRNLRVSVSLIVNCTPLGMVPHTNTSPWPDGVTYPRDAIVYDLVYNPLETLFVSEAREAGLMATTGLGMLVEQAALAFERWTGLKVPRDIMWQAAQGV